MNRSAFIIWTPLHLFNAIRFILSRDLKGKYDAYYICQSEGMEVYYNALKDSGVFRRLFYTNSEKVERNQRLWKLNSLIFSPAPYTRKVFGKDAAGNIYDRIFMSVPTGLNDSIIRSNNCKEVVGYDDGIGSYLTDLYGVPKGNKYEMIKKALGKDSYHVRRVFLNNPGYIIHNDDKEYENLLARKLTEDEEKQIKSIFGFAVQDKQSKYIYLNQPLKEVAGRQNYKQVEKQIIGVLGNELDRELSVRMHPREKDESLYNGISIEDNKQMWEIMCNEEAMNHKVMISSFSTAQFTPKFFFDKEPWVIFTLDMYEECCEKNTIIETGKLINLLRDSYSDKTKVISVKSTEELREKLHEIKENQQTMN